MPANSFPRQEYTLPLSLPREVETTECEAKLIGYIQEVQDSMWQISNIQNTKKGSEGKIIFAVCIAVVVVVCCSLLLVCLFWQHAGKKPSAKAQRKQGKEKGQKLVQSVSKICKQV